MRELVADLVAEGVDATVSETVRETVGAIETLIDKGDDDAVSLGKVAAELKLDKSAAFRRVKSAINKGFVKNLEYTTRPILGAQTTRTDFSYRHECLHEKESK